MTVVDYYHANIVPGTFSDDFLLFEFRDGFYLGFDSVGNLCVVIRSSSIAHGPIRQRTKMLSVECNIKLDCKINGEITTAFVHIVRCFSRVEKERELFLDLIDATIIDATSDDEILEAFRILSKFFADKSEPSDGELIGLYAELDAINTFSPSIHLEDYWQSKDRMKFDFSITDTLKLEVKATTKSTRIHHFRHEQLITDLYSIYVLSYMLREDDEGVSLFDLIIAVKPLLSRSPRKLLRIDKILKNVSEDRLKGFRFNSEYTVEKRHFYPADVIPKFSESTPDGVANAEYDCSLENLEYISDDDFITLVKTTQTGETIDG